VKHCLVVDNSRVIRKVACGILETLFFETEEAENGATALQACRGRMPDLILLDGHLPDMSGIDFLRNLRRNIRGRQPVVVYCTIENDAEHIGEALSAGASDHVMKPFDRDMLRAKLTDAGLL
jgi:two-component system chemotaxis response regulator CheY